MSARGISDRTYSFTEEEKDQYNAYQGTGHPKTANRFADKVDSARHARFFANLPHYSTMDPVDRLNQARSYVEFEPRDLAARDLLEAAEQNMTAYEMQSRALDGVMRDPSDERFTEFEAAQEDVSRTEQYYVDHDASTQKYRDRTRAAADRAHQDWQRAHRTAARTERAVNMVKRGARSGAVGAAGAAGSLGGAVGGGALAALAGGAGAPVGATLGGIAGGQAAAAIADRVLPRPRGVHPIFRKK